MAFPEGAEPGGVHVHRGDEFHPAAGGIDGADVGVGDAAGATPPLPKAGVYAVRQGPVLADNLRAVLVGRAPRRYRPQRRALALLATADGGAIAAWGPHAAQGLAWGWWKDRIDRGFIARYRG